jgi:hypothetical protein
MAGLLIFCSRLFSFLINLRFDSFDREPSSLLNTSILTGLPSVTPVTARLGIGVDLTLAETYIHRRGTYEGHP